MTARHGQVTGSATIAKPLSNGTAAGKERASAFTWEEWFSHASPQQRLNALSLAQQQGLLYPSQLPAISNGVHSTAPVPETNLSRLLPGLLSGKADALPALRPEPMTFVDAELDDLQRQAVMRAIATPDFFLLHGLPGTGKSRVLAEIILQSAARGQRVLFLAAHASSVDVVLQRLVGKPEVFVLRHLDMGENLDGLPGWLRGFTFEEQKQSFLARTLADVRGNHEKAMAACRQQSERESAWPELHACVQRRDHLSQRTVELGAELDGLAAAVELEASIKGPLALKLLDRLQPTLDALAAQQTELARCQHAHDECAANSTALADRIAALGPAYRAKKERRFWTPAFWANLFNGAVLLEMNSLLEQQATADAQRRALAVQITQIEQERQQQIAAFEQAQRELFQQEIAARRQDLLDQQQILDAEMNALDAHWNERCNHLEINPTARTAEAIRTAHEAWEQTKGQFEQQCQFAQQWIAFVEQAGPQLTARLPSFANVLALTHARWQADAKARESVQTPVDLLLIEDAETLTDAELQKYARHAHRCVLVASALTETVVGPVQIEKTPRAALASAAGCWNRLLRALDGDADHWPVTWRRDQGRLCCQLTPLSAEDLHHLDRECLVDAADIELGILHRPDTRPCLAQVIFPPQHQFAEAFTFMVREVQEFPLEPLGRTGWWHEDANHLCWRLGSARAHDSAWLSIEPGLRLAVAACAPGTETTRVACVEFDTGLGWDRARAEDWLGRHRRGQDCHRTAFLQTPYRFESTLASALQSIVRADGWLTIGLPEPVHAAPGLEFVAVPPLAKRDWPREGAGLELDLSASRQGDRLPAGLRPGLPARGVVNYLEAQALIRRVESWMQREAVGAGMRVGLLALFAAQVELLRRLVEQSEILRSRSFTLEVALPSRLHQWECDAAFLSLTRSHAHRCVSFGEDARELPLALTRARTQLTVFGDAGALCKRINWSGPLDHLDGHSAQQEQACLARLLARWQGQTLTPAHDK